MPVHEKSKKLSQCRVPLGEDLILFSVIVYSALRSSSVPHQYMSWVHFHVAMFFQLTIPLPCLYTEENIFPSRSIPFMT